MYLTMTSPTDSNYVVLMVTLVTLNEVSIPLPCMVGKVSYPHTLATFMMAISDRIS